MHAAHYCATSFPLSLSLSYSLTHAKKSNTVVANAAAAAASGAGGGKDGAELLLQALVQFWLCQNPDPRLAAVGGVGLFAPTSSAVLMCVIVVVRHLNQHEALRLHRPHLLPQHLHHLGKGVTRVA